MTGDPSFIRERARSRRAINQNYVPVVDDKGSFIGIITRKEIIKYCYKEMKKLSALHEKQDTSK